MENVKLTKEELHIADVIKKLFKSGYIQIEIHIVPQTASYGDGKWNITRTQARVGDDFIVLGEGSVEMIETT